MGSLSNIYKEKYESLHGGFYRINPDTIFGNNVKIGEHVIIEEGVVIGDNVVIGHNSVICEGAIIKDNTIIDHLSVIR